MTEIEAKEWLANDTSPMKIHTAEMQGESPMVYINEAIDVAIKSMEKQIAKKPIEGSFGVQCCPCCNEKVGQRVTRTLYENRMNYCWNCGVRIDWGNEDAELK